MLVATSVGDLSITPLAQLLRGAKHDSWTGRLVIEGDRPATLVFSGGRLCFAGIGGWAPLMLRLAEDGLFSPDEWAATLQTSSIPARWSKLVGGDAARLAQIETQVRDDITATLRWVAQAESGSFGFAPGRPHPFGVLTVIDIEDAAELAGVDLGTVVDLEEAFPHSDFIGLLREVNGVG